MSGKDVLTLEVRDKDDCESLAKPLSCMLINSKLLSSLSHYLPLISIHPVCLCLIWAKCHNIATFFISNLSVSEIDPEILTPDVFSACHFPTRNLFSV